MPSEQEAGMDIPESQYLRIRDGAFIAYQVVGDGPIDIAWQLDFGGNLDVWWESPWERAWFEGLASLGRLILHDWRGFGLSSRNVPVPNLETRTDDLRAVLDEVGSTSTVIGGWFESLAPGLLLAASDPSRVRALIWWNPSPRTVWAPDYPWGEGPAEVARGRDALKHWGTFSYGERWADTFEKMTGHRPPDEAIRWWAKQARNSCTPDVAETLQEIWWQSDIRGVLPSVQTPTLLIIGQDEGVNPPIANHVASLMQNAQIEVFPAPGWPKNRTEIDAVNQPRLAAIARHLGIRPKALVPETILSTILFTDIVDSTSHQARLGDRDWKRLVEHHNEQVREALATWRGRENSTAGDSFFATFDGPARAIRCAKEIGVRIRDLGLEVRAGVHTGECELVEGTCAGISVSTGARIAAAARPSQVLVSQTVKDLVAGSGLRFVDAGEHDLKGVPGRLHLYAVE
jgi:class 3 adenylate cyclase